MEKGEKVKNKTEKERKEWAILQKEESLELVAHNIGRPMNHCPDNKMRPECRR